MSVFFKFDRHVRPLLAAGVLCAALAPLQAHAGAVDGQGTWQTTLQGRDLDGNLLNGYEAYYDTSLNVTWLADAGTFNGTWEASKAWASQLNVNGVTGWRLADNKPVNGVGFQTIYSIDGSTDFAANITSPNSELAHMYYVTLGNKCQVNPNGTYNSVGVWGLNNTGPFSNVKSNIYWSNSEALAGLPFVFNFYDGVQFSTTSNYPFYAWAVHSGDVAPVPEPEAFALALAGVAIVWFMRRDRKVLN